MVDQVIQGKVFADSFKKIECYDAVACIARTMALSS